ncbi:MAG: DUF1893 domain-containing protein [Clostridia bacterium]
MIEKTKEKSNGYLCNLRLSTKICYTALFLALGVLFPQVFHLIGAQSGSMFLPMHIPVLIAGMFLGVYSGLTVGIISPIMSCLIFTMPPVAKLPFMVLELAAYGAISGLLGKYIKNVYLVLVSAMVGGRVVYAISIWVATELLQMKLPPSFGIIAAMSSGVIGMMAQIIIIPPIILLLRKYMKVNEFKSKTNDNYKEMLSLYTCAVIKNDVKNYVEHGIKPLLIHLEHDDFKDAIVVDRAVGKAAALLMVYGHAKIVYADIISQYAIEIFEQYGVQYKTDKIVPYIENRKHDGMCPMENKCLNIYNPTEAYQLLKNI